jgi:cell division septation protein DedD
VERSQVVWLTLGGIVTLGLAFALGVVVGRRAAMFSEPSAVANPVARADLAGAMHDRLTFYDKLTTTEQSAPPAKAKPAAEVDPDAAARTGLARGPAQSGEFTVQVSAYQSMAEASAFMASLKRKGFAPFVVKAEIAGKGTWYRVRIGRFVSEADATRAKAILAAADVPAWVLRME